MPTYEYRCQHCQYEFEAFQSISSSPIDTCPRCNQKAVTRKISGGSGLIFKGSGFYITDYSRKSNNLPKEKVEPAAVGSVDKSKGKAQSKSSDSASDKSE
jgi:putative FmdB family regulatory protein